MLKVALFTSVRNWWYDKVTLNKSHVLYDKIPKRLVKPHGNQKRVVRIDTYIGYMLKETCGSFAQVDLISPKKVLEMTQTDFKKYNVLITQFLSPLAIFQTYGTVADKRYRDILARNDMRVYPKPKYTNFVEDKCIYTNVLKKENFPVADSFCITIKDYSDSKDNLDGLIQRIVNKANKAEWDTVFAKPILGTGSWGTKRFDTKSSGFKRKMYHYLYQIFEKKKYPKLMFQENHPEFGTSFYEIRMVFVGDEYQYTVMNDVNGKWERPSQEGGKEPLPQLAGLKKTSRDIIEKIIKPLNPKGTPLLETRIDYGCCVGHVKGKYFINEIEYAGGLMTFMDKKSFGVHDKLASQLKKIIRTFI